MVHSAGHPLLYDKVTTSYSIGYKRCCLCSAKEPGEDLAVPFKKILELHVHHNRDEPFVLDEYLKALAWKAEEQAKCMC